jgi:hypothetical protein
MAKKAAKKKAKVKARAKARAPSAAVYYMTQTAKGAQIADPEHEADMKRIHDHIQRRGGSCKLYGDASDTAFITVIEGLSPRARNDLVQVIEEAGNVTATRFNIFKGGP